jgi:anti-sigma regulatory factor (Ser/Thr protein kinase)
MDAVVRAASATDRIEMMLADGMAKSIKHDTVVTAMKTLASLGEFAAIRWEWWQQKQRDIVDALPIHSHLAQRLRRVLPDLGRIQGPIPLVNTFATATGETHYIPPFGDGWDPGSSFNLFQERFRNAIRRRGVSADFADHLAGVINEIAGNAIEHSDSHLLSLATYQVSETFCTVSVTDVGCGVRDSIRKNPHYSEVAHDVEAMRLVLEDGVSCTGEHGRGNGFGFVFRGLVDRMCLLRFRSVEAGAFWHGKGPARQQLGFSALPRRAGFHFAIAVPLSIAA